MPTLIFFMGWLRWYWALFFGGAALYACIRGVRDSISGQCLMLGSQVDWSVMFKALMLIVLWVYLSGIGGYCFQNSDHYLRNTMFRALVERSWPVVSYDGDRGLIYYIGFWLPAACAGKVFGLRIGYASQFIWAVIGIFIVYYLICVYRKKVDLLPIVFLILFSGLDYVGTWLLGDSDIDWFMAPHIEWWARVVQFSSTTTQLFWVFNQAIPAWIVTMLIMVQKNSRNMLFILSLAMLSATFPFVGLIPIVVYLYIRYVMEDRQRWKDIFTFQNIVGVIVIGGVVFLYLTSNVSGGKVGAAKQGETAFMHAADLLRYLLFYFLEFGIYLCFVCKYRKKDPMIWLITCILVICPFVIVGSSGDFCMRASIPALFILMLFCIETFERMFIDGRKYLFAAFCLVLALGAVTPFNEIHRSIKETFQRSLNGESVRHEEISIEEMLGRKNFSGKIENNLFYRYLADSF